MFKKLIALTLILSIFTVQAHAASPVGLKAAFDELNYSLTTEWDQKDKKFYDKKMNDFSAVVKDLQSKGMTNADLLTFVKSEVKNEKIARDLETAFNMISINKMSPSEAQKYMTETMKKSYANGASWNGSADVLIGLGVLLLIVAVVAAGGTVNVNSCQEYYCGTECDYYGCYDLYCCY